MLFLSVCMGFALRIDAIPVLVDQSSPREQVRAPYRAPARWPESLHRANSRSALVAVQIQLCAWSATFARTNKSSRPKVSEDFHSASLLKIRAKVTFYRRLSPTVFSQIAALIRPKRSS